MAIAHPIIIPPRVANDTINILQKELDELHFLWLLANFETNSDARKRLQSPLNERAATIMNKIEVIESGPNGPCARVFPLGI